MLLSILISLASAGELRAPLLELLSAPEHTATADELRALGPDVDNELRALADDATVPHSRRGRAVTALAHFPTATTRVFLDTQLKGADTLLSRKAAWSLARGFGDDAVPMLVHGLANEDRRVREATVKALGSLGSPAAREALVGAHANETDTHVKAAMHDALEAK